MKIFIQALDYDLWKIITRWSHTPTIVVNGMTLPKLKKDKDEYDKRMAQLNTKAINVLYCFLDVHKFNRISTCKSAKKI